MSLGSQHNGKALVLASTAAVGLAAVASYFAKKIRKNARQTCCDLQPDTRNFVGVELDNTQKHMVISQDAGGDHVVCTVLLEGRIPTHEDIISAVKSMQIHHCILRSMMFLDSDGMLRLREHIYPASDTVTMCVDESWQDVADRCLNATQFLEDTPTSLWKLLFCTGGDEAGLVFILNHAVFDGTSRNRFLHQFLLRCNDQLLESQSIINVKELSKNIKKLSWPRFAILAFHFTWSNLRGMR